MKTVNGWCATLLRVGVAAICVTIASATLWAQLGSQGAFVGTVKDSSGASVSGATVTVTNIGTGLATTAMTTTEGQYRVPNLLPGQYRLEAAQTGFRNELHADIELTVGQTQQVDFTLQVGANTETVTVTGEAPLVDTSTSSVASLVNQQQVQDLPLNGRDYSQLVYLTPGVANSGAATNSDRGNSTFEVGGARPTATRIMVDGTEFSGGSNTNTLPSAASSKMLGVESISEFNVSQNNGDATVGKAEGGQITLVTRSGTNDFHGSAYEYFRSNLFNARNFFATINPRLTRNSFGASVGGPIKKDKTFFFFNWERYLDTEDIPQTVIVPSPAARGIGFNGIEQIPTGSVVGGVCQIAAINPATGAQSVNVGTNPTGLGNLAAVQASASVMSFYPAGNGSLVNTTINGVSCPAGTQNSSLVTPRRIPDNFYLGRVDEQISQKQSIFARYWIQAGTRTVPQNDVLGQFPIIEPYRDQIATVGDRYAFTSGLLNQFNASYNRSRYYIGLASSVPQSSIPAALTFITPTQEATYHVPGDPALVDLGVVTVGTCTGGNTNCSIMQSVNNCASGCEQHRVARQVAEADDQLSYSRGKHFLQGGAQFQRIMSNDLDGNDPAGVMTFNNLLTFAQGNTSAASRSQYGGFLPGSNSAVSLREFYTGLYAQDSYRMNSNFTLNLGLRWEFMSDPTESHGHMTQWYPVLGGDGACAATILCFPTFPTFPYPASVSEPGLVYPAANAFTANNSGNWGPRVGFAWNVFGSGKTSVRGGFGIYYDQIQNLWRQASSTASPFYNAVTLTGTSLIWPNPGQGLAVAAPGSLSVTDSQPDPKIPTMTQYNLTIQQQILPQTMLSVGYVGNAGDHQSRTVNFQEPAPVINSIGRYAMPIAATGPGIQNALNPALNGTSTFYRWDANTSYNSLQATLERRMNHGFLFKAVYAYSKTLETAPDNTATTVGIATANNSWALPKFDKGPSAFNVTQVFTLNWVYDTPQLTQSKMVGTFVNGWELAGIYHQQGGLPFSVFDGISQVYFNTSSATSGNGRADYNPSPTGARLVGGHSLNMPYFNTGDFVPSPLGMLGNSSAGVMYGPGEANVDISLMKYFNLTERIRLNFRVDAFNLLNHPSFELPAISLFTSVINTNPTTGASCALPSASGSVAACTQAFYAANPITVPSGYTRSNSAGFINQTLPDSQRELQFALKVLF